MANVLIVATGSVYTGTSDGDSIQFQSGALQGSQILGEGGSDTINLDQAFVGATKNGFLANGGAGNDSIFVDANTFKASAGPTIKGAGGNDTITFSGGFIQSLQGQDNNDVINAEEGTTFSTLAAGKGADNVTFSGAISGSLGLGRGHDVLSGGLATFGSSASLALGEGRDTLNLQIASNGSAQVVLGDAGNGTRAGADLIELGAGVITAIAFNAGGGSDTITLSGGFLSANLAAGLGDDSINLTATTMLNSTLGGGAGADTIYLENAFITSGNVNGGLGNDSITLGTENAAGNVGTIQGGAGADSITLSGTVANASTLNTQYFSALSESNLANTDVLTIDLADGHLASGTFDFNNSASLANNVGASSAGVLFGSTKNKAIVEAGIVTFSGTLATDAVSSVTAAMINVDKLTLGDGVGEVAIFTANGAEFLFMQGGSSGTSDDGLVNLGTNDVTIASLTVDAGGSATHVTFSGN
jgi:hypothetical protein